jgi:hypothetical protein
MKNYGCSSVSEFIQDRIVYRNLVPVDPSLPSLADYRAHAGEPLQSQPRKHEPAYARYIAWLLQRGRQQDAPGASLRRVLFIGDTRLGDATAFDNICQAGGWTGMIFIGSGNQSPPLTSVEPTPGGQEFFMANRWSALPDFERYVKEKGFPIDESTVVLVDLDKTAIGARGRNERVIDQARVKAVRVTVEGLLGEGFNEAAFLAAYRHLDRPDFHPFTLDNQDYLAYICLILGSGFTSLGGLLEEIRLNETHTFTDWIERVEDSKTRLAPALSDIHAQIYDLVRTGDPTPFKAFRRNEYLETSARMGCLPDEAPVEDLLENEIVITEEVRQQALEWGRQGALVFGLSDKPDEASLPTPEQERKGALPLHRIKTHCVGSL